MRSVLLILATLVLLGGGLAAYVWLQPDGTHKPIRASSTTPSKLQQRLASTTQSLGGVGSGDNPWIKQYANGELSTQFRGERYEPQSDGFHVERPQAEFFSTDGRQRIRIEGVTGDIVTPAPPPSSAKGRNFQNAGADF